MKGLEKLVHALINYEDDNEEKESIKEKVVKPDIKKKKRKNGKIIKPKQRELSKNCKVREEDNKEYLPESPKEKLPEETKIKKLPKINETCQKNNTIPIPVQPDPEPELDPPIVSQPPVIINPPQPPVPVEIPVITNNFKWNSIHGYVAQFIQGEISKVFIK